MKQPNRLAQDSEWLADWIAIRSQRGWAGGRNAYRYGVASYKNVLVELKPRISLPGKPKTVGFLGKRKRQDITDLVSAAMKNWRYSPFEFEATAYHWLRQSFCGQGHGFAASEAEARLIVSEALKGHVRPTWEMGQRLYTVGDDFCRGCGGPLDDTDIANSVRYCCDECRKILYHRNARLSRGDVTILAPVKCKNPDCDVTFFPRNFLHECCSHACRVVSKSHSLPKRRCETCWQEFQPNHEKSLYCTPLCRSRAQSKKKREATAAARPVLTCEWCNEPFKPGKWNSRFCSEKHQKAASRVRERAAKEAKAANSDHPINKLFDAA